VGKTSSANVISDFLRPLAPGDIVSARFNCHRETSYRQIWESLFEKAELPTKGEFEPFTVNHVVNSLRNVNDKMLIFIIDEFDRIEDPDIDIMIADTVKALSDFDIDTTLILVGVADDVDDLISEHQSIDRCLVQIPLSRMPSEDLAQIVKHGISEAGMDISEEAVSEICTVSLGLPHYVHSLSIAAGRAAIEEQCERVDTAHVQAAIEASIRESGRSILRQFDLATASPRRENLYFKVLLACALARTDDLGFFRASDVREPYSHIMAKEMKIPSFGRHLHGLSEEDRGPILQRSGKSHQYRYRFFNPLMQPYVLMRGMQSGVVTLDNITRFTEQG